METSARPPIDAVGVYLEAKAPAFSPTTSEGDANRKRTFSGIAYSGEAVSYWGESMVIDLSSIILPDPCPILMDHDRDRPVGHGHLSVRDNALHAEGALLSNETARSLASDADDGFPWQFSVHAEPGSVEEVSAGTGVQVNGRSLQGPVTVLRNSRIRELSFTPTGVDFRTEAHVLSAPARRLTSNPTKEKPMPTIEELQSQIAQLSAQVKTSADEIKAANDRADSAEQALAKHKRDARLSAVKGVFAGLGRPIEEKDAEVYLSLPDAAWDRVAADLSKPKPTNAPDHLFSEQATGDPSEPAAKPLNFSAIYSARRGAKQ